MATGRRGMITSHYARPMKTRHADRLSLLIIAAIYQSFIDAGWPPAIAIVLH